MNPRRPFDGVLRKAAAAAKGTPEAAAPEAEKEPRPKSLRMSYEELETVAEQTRRNTDRAIQELRDELKRLNGHVVRTDYAPLAASYARALSLDEAVLRQELRGLQLHSSSSSSSSRSSWSDEYG